MQGVCDLASLNDGIVDGLTFRNLVEQDAGIHHRCHVNLLKCKVWGLPSCIDCFLIDYKIDKCLSSIGDDAMRA